MKVVRESPLGFNLEFECRTCKSVLEAEIDDVKVGNFSSSYCDAPASRYYVECPVCGTKRVLEASELNYKVRAAADKRDRESK